MRCRVSVVMETRQLSIAIYCWLLQVKTFGNDKWTHIEEDAGEEKMGDEGKQARGGAHEDDPWGWFEDVEHGVPQEQHFSPQNMGGDEKKIRQTPSYVLEDSLSAQALWHMTSGQRPRQPDEERRYFENLWLANFEKSRASFTKADTLESPSGPSPARSSSCGEDVFVVYKAKNSFGTGVSKSFKCDQCHKITTYMVGSGDGGSSDLGVVFLPNIISLGHGCIRCISWFHY